jgi:hypothetical protein
VTIDPLPCVATIATIPSRQATFAQVLSVIAPQVDRVFVYLDGFDEVPALLAEYPHVTVIRSEDERLRAAGRFLCLLHLSEPTVVVSVDDDIHYPPDYVQRLRRALDEAGGDAVVGVHGTRFTPPFRNYVRDGKTLWFARRLWRTARVDQLGAGTVAFRTDRLLFDVRQWHAFRCDDIMLAGEAKKRGLPLLCIPRRTSWMRSIGEYQTHSLWREIQQDPAEETALMRQLLADRVADYESGFRGRFMQAR